MKPTTRLGEYVITARLAEDAFGTLHRAVRVEGGGFGRHALLRRFEPALLAAGLRATLKESVPQSLQVGEARGLAPHCRIYHAAAEPWITYDLDPGLPLSEMLELCRAQGMALGLEHVLTVLRDLAGVLDHLQSRGVPHGLLLPELVWVTHEGSVLLLDAAMAPQVRGALAGWPQGRPRVLDQAPAGSLDRDLYLLACLGWQMLTLGRTVPSRPEDLRDTLVAAAASLEAGLPPSLLALFERMVGLGPRYQDFAAFHAESLVVLNLEDHAPSTFNLAFLIHTLLRDRIPTEQRQLASERAATWTVSAAVPVLSQLPPPVPARRRPWITVAALGAVLGASVLGVLFFQRAGSRESDALRRALAEAQRQQAEREQVKADVEATLQREVERRARLQAQLGEARDAARLEALNRELEATRDRQAELQARQARARAEAEAAAQQARRLQARVPAALPMAPPQGPAPAPSAPRPAPPLPAEPAVPLKAVPPKVEVATDAPPRLLAPLAWNPPGSWKGAVRLRVFVGEGGRALRVLVAEGPGGAVDAAAQEAALKGTYQSGLSGGRPQRSWLEVELSAR